MQLKNKLIKLLDSNSFHNFSKLLTGTVLGQILSVILVPIATRMYGAESYGDLAIFTSNASLILSFLGFGLSSAIMVADTDEEAQGVYKISIYFTLIITLIMIFVLILISPFVKLYNSSLNYHVICILIGFMVVTSNMINMSYAWLNRLGKYNILLWNPVITPIINNTVLLLLGWLGYKKVGLLAGTISAQLVTLAHMKRYNVKVEYKITIHNIKYLLRKYSDFVLFQYPSSITNGISNQMPVLFLAYYFGNTVVGYYSMAQRLLSIPIGLIGTSIGRVFFKNISDISRQNGNVRSYTYNIIKKIMILYTIPALVVFISGDFLVPFLLGSEWAPSGNYIRIMMIWNMFYLIVNCTAGFPSVINMQKENLANGIIMLVSDSAIIIITSILFDNPLISITLFTITHVIIHVLFFNTMIGADKILKNKYLIFSLKIFITLGIVFILIRGMLLFLGQVKCF